jgi:1-acyl-sn-glycerol-3-phosphate acyltransferase
MAEEKQQLKLGREPNSFLFNFIGEVIVVSFARLYYGIRVKKDPIVTKMKGPLVVMGNHPSYLDPFVMAMALYGRKINFVAGAFLFRSRIVGPMFAAGGCIPKVQFRSDSRAVKAMLHVLKRGGTLGIFPEGTRFVDGTSIKIDDALARMIKKTNSGMAFLVSNGAYATWPRWSTNSFRRGRVTGHISRAYSVEEVQEMTVEEIHEIMLKHLDYNENDWLRENPRTFRSKSIAAGAQNIAYVCPRCEAENSTVADKDVIRCTKCGNQARMDGSYFFHPVTEQDRVFPDLHAWKEWEKDRIRNRIKEPSFVFSEPATLLRPWGEYEYREVGRGVISIKNGNIVYEGTECAIENGITYSKKELKAAKRKSSAPDEVIENARTVTKSFPAEKIRGISAEYGKRFELTEYGGEINRFILRNGQRVLELQLIIQCLQEATRISD